MSRVNEFFLAKCKEFKSDPKDIPNWVIDAAEEYANSHQRRVDNGINGNFISANKEVAINSYGIVFNVGELVGHEDETAGTATIESFEFDDRTMEIKANTSLGFAHIDFITKLN